MWRDCKRARERSHMFLVVFAQLAPKCSAMVMLNHVRAVVLL